MSGLKKSLTVILRILGVCGLAVLLGAGWYCLEAVEPTGEAKAVFAGTAEDADCTILLSSGSCVLIDTGEAADASHIRELLREYGAERIDCMILTHPDKDHIGGASALLEEFTVAQMIVPYFSGEKEAYELLLAQAGQLRVPVQTLSRDRQYRFGEWDIRVFPPEKFYYEKTNEYSLAVLAEHGESRMFLAGDAQKERMQELLGLKLSDMDVYKAAHHGRDSKECIEMIEKLKPEYGIVTAKKPEKKTREAFEAAGSKIICTVPEDVIFISDGRTIHP